MKSVKILLVEDDPSVSEAFEFVLVFAGYSVTTADSVPDALSEMDNRQYNVLITDGLLKGKTSCSLVQSRNRPPIAIMVSGYSDFQNVPGFDAYLTKPIQMSDLLELLESKLSVIEAPKVISI